MTTLINDIHIDARPEVVWEALARLDLLADIDPGAKASAYTSEQTEGVGASRRTEVPGGFFEDVVTEWVPNRSLDLELTRCSFPVRALNHRYTLEPADGGTRVRQVQRYEMKWGPVGRAMDALLIRRKWNSGVKAFLEGLKSYVESKAEPRG